MDLRGEGTLALEPFLVLYLVFEERLQIAFPCRLLLGIDSLLQFCELHGGSFSAERTAQGRDEISLGYDHEVVFVEP